MSEEVETSEPSKTIAINKKNVGLPMYTILTAGAIIALYLGLVLLMILDMSQPDIKASQWQRAILIYSGFMSFATAAAGVLMGTQIQQSNVNLSNERADEAKSENAKVRAVVRSAIDTMERAPTESGGSSLQDMSSVKEMLRRAL